MVKKTENMFQRKYVITPSDKSISPERGLNYSSVVNYVMHAKDLNILVTLKKPEGIVNLTAETPEKDLFPPSSFVSIETLNKRQKNPKAIYKMKNPALIRGGDVYSQVMDSLAEYERGVDSGTGSFTIARAPTSTISVEGVTDPTKDPTTGKLLPIKNLRNIATSLGVNVCKSQFTKSELVKKIQKEAKKGTKGPTVGDLLEGSHPLESATLEPALTHLALAEGIEGHPRSALVRTMVPPEYGGDMEARARAIEAEHKERVGDRRKQVEAVSQRELEELEARHAQAQRELELAEAFKRAATATTGIQSFAGGLALRKKEADRRAAQAGLQRDIATGTGLSTKVLLEPAGGEGEGPFEQEFGKKRKKQKKAKKDEKAKKAKKAKVTHKMINGIRCRVYCGKNGGKYIKRKGRKVYIKC